MSSTFKASWLIQPFSDSAQLVYILLYEPGGIQDQSEFLRNELQRLYVAIILTGGVVSQGYTTGTL